MIRTGKELARQCLYVAEKVKTLYVLGSFGWPMNFANQQRVISSYRFNADITRSTEIRRATADTFGFDCICFVKALLWGWSAETEKEYGGAVYQSGGVPDIDETEMLSRCHDVSEDFSDIQIGEFLWTQGHCGIYVGDGYAVECTYRWNDGVQKTAVFNILGQGTEKGRFWDKHGKLPYITYDECEVYKLKLTELKKGAKGETVRALQLLLMGNGFSCGTTGADGDFGGNTERSLISYQSRSGISADGVAGEKTMGRLLGVECL